MEIMNVVLLVVLASMATLISAEGYYGNTPYGKPKYEYHADPVQNYRMLPTIGATGQERALCFGKYSPCQMRILRCPLQCPKRTPTKRQYANYASGDHKYGKKLKACLVDCGKCEATCRDRKPKCEGYGAICYDPRFIGGDGVIFYFHGAKDKDFALVSDEHIQINAHFIGKRPQGRNRDYTWVQALGFLFGKGQSFSVGVERTSSWDERIDRLYFTYNGEAVEIVDKWISPSEVLVVERTDETNAMTLMIKSVAKISLRAVPVDEKDNKVHNYQIPEDDVFAHLEMQFEFEGLSPKVEGVLGQTYRPDYVSPAKKGVPMPVLGGEDRYAISSLLSPMCSHCIFGVKGEEGLEAASGVVSGDFRAQCGSMGGSIGGGIVCRR